MWYGSVIWICVSCSHGCWWNWLWIWIIWHQHSWGDPEPWLQLRHRGHQSQGHWLPDLHLTTRRSSHGVLGTRQTTEFLLHVQGPPPLSPLREGYPRQSSGDSGVSLGSTPGYVLFNAHRACHLANCVTLYTSCTPPLLNSSTLLCFDALSWLTMDHSTRQRRTCLPIHLFILSKLYHLFSTLEQSWGKWHASTVYHSYILTLYIMCKYFFVTYW